jgi:hypothetical protein
MPMTAAILAGGISTNLKLGAADTPASDLRAGLTALLTQHVRQVGKRGSGGSQVPSGGGALGSPYGVQRAVVLASEVGDDGHGLAAAVLTHQVPSGASCCHGAASVLSARPL